MVRAAGVEPALLSELDFESSASTNSTTPAAEGPPHATEAKAASSPEALGRDLHMAVRATGLDAAGADVHFDSLHHDQAHGED